MNLLCRLLLLLIISLLFNITQFAQTSETEPNDAIGNSGIIIMDMEGTYTGNIHKNYDRYDNWYLEHGASGQLTVDFSFTGTQAVCKISSATGNYNSSYVEANISQNSSAEISVDANKYYTFNIATFLSDGTYSIELTGGGLLPVVLTNFKGLKTENGILLQWETATEINNYGFELERSRNGNIFNKIAFVEGYGNSNSPKFYSFTDESAEWGKYFYRLKQIDFTGVFEYSNVIEVDIGNPRKYELEQNYPNPFNPVTTISFSLPEASFVNLEVYDILGRNTVLLINEILEAGEHSFEFNAGSLPSGIYYYKITAGEFTKTNKMILLK